MPELDFFDEGKKLDLTSGKNYLLVAATDSRPDSGEYLFQCPTENVEWIPGGDGCYTSVSLNKLGTLVYKSGNTIEETYKAGKFCVTPSKSQTLTYGPCSSDNRIKTSRCEEVRRIVFDTGFCLSIIFIILSIIAHLIENTLKKTMFGKVSLMYLLNMLGQFLSIMIDRWGGFQACYGSGYCPCEVLGYFLQYFNLSFFFSLHILAFYCYRTATTMNAPSSLKAIRKLSEWTDPSNSSFLKKSFAYIQLVPMLIVLTTYGVDSVRKGRVDTFNSTGNATDYDYAADYDTGAGCNATNADPVFSRDISYPEMALYPGSCYLGYEKASGRPNYFITPEFIYVQSFQLFIIATNFIMFVLVIKTLVTRTRAKTANENKYTEALKEFKVMLKLYFVMVFLWMFEIITSGIAADHGIIETCQQRFVLDLPNAFFGLLVFLVMVCSRPTVVKSLKSRLGDTLTTIITGNSIAAGNMANSQASKAKPTEMSTA